MSNITRFTNCSILRNHNIIKEDLWVEDGTITDPEVLFYKHATPTKVIDCKNNIIVPGFIDLQINGAFGWDFTNNLDDVEEGVLQVAQGLLQYGVIAFCPTVITTSRENYRRILGKIRKTPGGKCGAAVLGVHVEGPFISKEKRGAHLENLITTFEEGFSKVEEVYGDIDNLKIVTLAPELDKSEQVIKEFVKRCITVSIGHTSCDFYQGEKAFLDGATMITHLFNAMVPFHHRNVGLLGLLAQRSGRQLYFGIIADLVHNHEATLRVARNVNPCGLVLVTDAISALGLEEGTHKLGEQDIDVRDGAAYISGTGTLCGSVTPLDQCVRNFIGATGEAVEGFEAASLRPACLVGLSGRKGTLDFGADGDFVMLDEDLEVRSTWIGGECVYSGCSCVRPSSG